MKKSKQIIGAFLKKSKEIKCRKMKKSKEINGFFVGWMFFRGGIWNGPVTLRRQPGRSLFAFRKLMNGKFDCAADGGAGGETSAQGCQIETGSSGRCRYPGDGRIGCQGGVFRYH